MKVFFIVLSSFLNLASAEVFKCQTQNGKVYYQAFECDKSSRQKKLEIQKIDPEITRIAIEQLNKDIAADKAKQREIRELEAAQAKQNNHSVIIENNTEIYHQNDFDRSYYPSYGYPVVDRRYRRKVYNPGRASNNRRRKLNPPVRRKSSLNPPAR